jgi:signal transduction histidine kinase
VVPSRRRRLSSQSQPDAVTAALCFAASSLQGTTVIRSFWFVLRLVAAWAGVVLLAALLWSGLPWIGNWELPPVLFGFVTMGLVITGTLSHIGRVRLIADRIDRTTLANRQRRQVEIPFEAGEAFDLVDAAIRELPGVEQIESARDSLQVKAKVRRPQTYGEYPLGRWNPLVWFGIPRNQVLATVAPAGDSGSVTVICEPESPAWSDLFRVDDGTNHENAEAITRAITRRIAERRRGEQAAAAQTATEKELTVAKLSLLHAQVEPHFLYNTLASAQLLARSDPERAESMLGHLIQYLRHSLPRTNEAQSTLGEELERALAYLEILKIRMGSRLTLQVDVPDALRHTPLPPMMLQTLVENAIKHGLEPKTAGGTVWIRARRSDDIVSITVADDGDGFSAKTGGTGIGLKNVRERLQLLYDGAASLAVVANFPAGVAATISVPAASETVREAQHG